MRRIQSDLEQRGTEHWKSAGEKQSSSPHAQEASGSSHNMFCRSRDPPAAWNVVHGMLGCKSRSAQSNMLLMILWLAAALVSIRFVVLLIMEPSLRDPTAILSRPLPMRAWAPLPGRVVVSMSTMGGRGHYLVRSLPSLLNQTYPPDQIIITISKVSPS